MDVVILVGFENENHLNIFKFMNLIKFQKLNMNFYEKTNERKQTYTKI